MQASFFMQSTDFIGYFRLHIIEGLFHYVENKQFCISQALMNIAF